MRHKGTPDYDLAAQLVQDLPVPVIVTGGMDGADHVRWVFEYTGCEAVMLARGSLGNPWLFEQVLGAPRRRADAARRSSRSGRGCWTAPRSIWAPIAPPATCASSTRGTSSGWARRRAVQDGLQRAETLAEQREIIAEFGATMLGRAAV